MIQNSTPLTFLEVLELSGDNEKAQRAKAFIKRFTRIKLEEARQMKKELEDLNILKLKEEHIVKVVDFMPEDATDLTKIIPDASLDQEETNKILDVVKKY